MAESRDHFDSSRAELFEALGHPVRVKILEALERRPMGFAELKRDVGIESSGHLQFHLGKLSSLVGTTAEGSYTLTDDGREAIRVLKSTSSGSEETATGMKALLGRTNLSKLLLAVLLISLIVLAGVAAYQQQQIATLNRNLSANTVTIGQTKYYYENIPSYAPNGTSVTLHGVTFTYVELPSLSYSNPANYIFKGSVRLSNGTTLDLNGKVVMIEMQGWLSHWLTSANSTTPGYGTVMLTEIAVSFPDGSHETFNGFNVSARYGGYNGTEVWLTYAFQPNPANPWFGEHRSPQAGVFWNYASPQNDLTIYVSA